MQFRGHRAASVRELNPVHDSLTHGAGAIQGKVGENSSTNPEAWECRQVIRFPKPLLDDNVPLFWTHATNATRHYSADVSRFRTFSLVSSLSAWEPIHLADFDSSFLICVATLTASRLSFRLRFPICRSAQLTAFFT